MLSPESKLIDILFLKHFRIKLFGPPVPAFYHQPETILDLVNDNVSRVLDLFDLNSGLLRPCGE